MEYPQGNRGIFKTASLPSVPSPVLSIIRCIFVHIFLVVILIFSSVALSHPAHGGDFRDGSSYGYDRLAIPTEASIFDDFSADPRQGLDWEFISGRWGWRDTGIFLAKYQSRNTVLWSQPEFESGTLSARLKLIRHKRTTRSPKAGLIFAYQPDGAYRYVLLLAGSPGKVILGQSGTIDGRLGGKIKAARVNIPRRRWRELRVEILQTGGVEVYLEGVLVLSHDDLPPVTGKIGLRSILSKVLFDDFYFIDNDDPNTAPCAMCHGGSPPPEYAGAPNMMTYWDGTWWDENMGGYTYRQQGGHGDPGTRRTGNPTLVCTDCHDLRQSRSTHRNGSLEGRGNPTENTYHLKAGFFSPDTSVGPGPWSVQVTFDNYCYNTCHSIYNVTDHRHEKDSLENPGGPENFPERWSVWLGQHSSDPDGESLPYTVDSDLTTLAPNDDEDYFAPCVYCHDPHGTGMPETKNENSIGIASNWMIRDLCFKKRPYLCLSCH